MRTLVEIARSQLGICEDPAHTNRGEAIRKYQEATNLDGQGWPWCTGCVDWCVQEWAKQGGMDIAKVPVTASAFGLIAWAINQGFKVFDKDPQPGDIVVYKFSHCGIVTETGPSSMFKAVEGNTNEDGGRDGYEVAERTRNLKAVKKFIRITT